MAKDKKEVNTPTEPVKEEVPATENVEKKDNEWTRMKHFLFTHKRYVLTLFPVILVAIFLGSMCSSWQKNGYNLYFILCLVGVILLLGVSIWLVIITKKQFIKNNVSTNVYISIIFAYMFLSGLILMIGYKVLSMIDPKNILNITGLVSVIVLVVYILSVIGAFYINTDKVKNLFKKKSKDK